MIKLTILLLAIIALSWAQSDVETEWANFKVTDSQPIKIAFQKVWVIVTQTKHGKSYAGAEEASRKKIFATTHAQITAHNSKNLGYQMGHNFLSDMVNIFMIILPYETDSSFRFSSRRPKRSGISYSEQSRL